MENFIRTDWEKFRHDLAFPMGTEQVVPEDADAAFDYLVNLCGLLPRFYGEELDRANLWGRIDGALAVMASRCSRSDEIADCLLSHICADPVRVAADAAIKDFLEPPVKIAAVKQIVATRRLLVICKARALWMETKSC